jgi:hypothetical protein
VSLRKKKTATWGGGLELSKQALDRTDLRCLGAFGALGYRELDPLTLLQGLEAGCLDLREMREQILATAFGRDEAEAFGLIEPLDRTLCHLKTSLKKEKGNNAGRNVLLRADDQVRKSGEQGGVGCSNDRHREPED